MVKKCSVLKIVHDKYKKRRGEEPLEKLKESFDTALQENKDLEALVDKTQVSEISWLVLLISCYDYVKKKDVFCISPILIVFYLTDLKKLMLYESMF